MIPYLRNLYKVEFVRNISTLISGTAISFIIPFILSPILTRLFTPSEFGDLSLFIGIGSVLVLFSTGSYESAIVLPKKDTDAFSLLVFSAVICVAFSIFTGLIAFLFKDSVSSFFMDPDSGYFVLLIPVYILLFGIFRTMSNWMNRIKKYKYISYAKVSRAATGPVSQVGFGFLNFSALGLIIGELIGMTIRTFSLIYFCRKLIHSLSKEIRFTKVIAIAKKYRHFPKFSMFSGIINHISSQSPIFLLPLFFNNTILGMYSLPNKYLTVPLYLIGNAISLVYFKEAVLIRHKSEELATLTYKIFKKLVYVGIIPFAIVFVYGDLIFSFVFGPEWSESGVYARMISPWLFFVFISSPVSAIFTVHERLKEGLIFNMVLLILRISSLCIGGLMYKDPIVTILMFGIFGFLYWAFLCFYVLKLAYIKFHKAFVFLIVRILIVLIPLFVIKEILF